MVARDTPLTIVIPGRFHPAWSPIGRGLRRLTGDRLQAKAFHLFVLTGGALLWLMALYAADALAEALALQSSVLYALLGGTGLLFALAGAVGIQPQARVTCTSQAVHIERGRERFHLPYDTLAAPKPVASRLYHRHYRHYAAVHPILGASEGPVLLLPARSNLIVALGLCAKSRAALARRVQKGRRRRSERQAAAAEGTAEAVVR